MNEIKEILDIKEFSDIVSEMKRTLPYEKFKNPRSVPEVLEAPIQGCINKRYLLSNLAIKNNQPAIKAFPNIVADYLKETEHQWLKDIYNEACKVEPLGDDFLLLLVIIEEVSRFGRREFDNSKHLDIIPSDYYAYLNKVKKKLDKVIEQYENAKDVIVKPAITFSGITVVPDLWVDGKFISFASSKWEQFGNNRKADLMLIDTLNTIGDSVLENSRSMLYNLFTNSCDFVDHKNRDVWVNRVKQKVTLDEVVSKNIKKELVEKKKKQKVNIRVSLWG